MKRSGSGHSVGLTKNPCCPGTWLWQARASPILHRHTDYTDTVDGSVTSSLNRGK